MIHDPSSVSPRTARIMALIIRSRLFHDRYLFRDPTLMGLGGDQAKEVFISSNVTKMTKTLLANYVEQTLFEKFLPL